MPSPSAYPPAIAAPSGETASRPIPRPAVLIERPTSEAALPINDVPLAAAAPPAPQLIGELNADFVAFHAPPINPPPLVAAAVPAAPPATLSATPRAAPPALAAPVPDNAARAACSPISSFSVWAAA